MIVKKLDSDGQQIELGRLSTDGITLQVHPADEQYRKIMEGIASRPMPIFPEENDDEWGYAEPQEHVMVTRSNPRLFLKMIPALGGSVLQFFPEDSD